MSRRSGQVGSIERKGGAYRARFLLDVPGCERRVYKSVFIAPVSGPGSLNKFELKRRLKEIVAEAGANNEVTLRAFEAVTLSTTFRQQAREWLDSLQSRKRKPIKAATARSWESALRWINEHIGDAPLSSINNRLVKEQVVTRMAGEMVDGEPRFSAKSISNYVAVVKMVVASAVNDDGEELYPVKWNHEFMDLPVISHQRTPSFVGEEVTELVRRADGQLAILYTLLAGTGLRVGEALALQVEDVVGSVLLVTKTLDAGSAKLQAPKTANGVREVDLHPALAEIVALHIDGRKTGSLFFSETGGPLHQSNLLRRSLHVILTHMDLAPRGFHAFRRYRNTHLRKARVPDGLIKFWMGHAPETMTDRYDRVREDREFRRFTAEQVGLGFELPQVRRGVGSEIVPAHPHTVALTV